MSWNHRILAHLENEEVYFKIHEVFYNKRNIPNGYCLNAASVGSETIKGITWTINKMLASRNKPILWAGERFPNEYKLECDVCGSTNVVEAPHMGKNCNDCHPL